MLSWVAVIHFAVTFMANSWTLSPAHTGCVCASTSPATKVEKGKMLSSDWPYHSALSVWWYLCRLEEGERARLCEVPSIWPI